MSKRRASRGFTLIEIMVSAAIIGILASVAIPSFQRSVLRAKVAERRPSMMHIARTLQDTFARNGSIVPGGGTLDSEYNPPLPPGPSRRPMSTTMPVWNMYSTGPAAFDGGGVYYSYRFFVEETPALGRFTVWAASDLEGDGAISFKQLVFTRGANGYELTSEFPPAGQEDDAGPYATF